MNRVLSCVLTLTLLGCDNSAPSAPVVKVPSKPAPPKPTPKNPAAPRTPTLAPTAQAAPESSPASPQDVAEPDMASEPARLVIPSGVDRFAHLVERFAKGTPPFHVKQHPEPDPLAARRYLTPKVLTVLDAAQALGKLPPRGRHIPAPLVFKDATGVNVVKFQAKQVGEDQAMLVVRHERKRADGGWTDVRVFRERIEGCVDSELSDASWDELWYGTMRPHVGPWSLSDLDADGVAEVTFAYTVGCRESYEPTTHKVLMTEDGEKYALRGKTWVHGKGGMFKPGRSWSKAPPGFRAHAERVWRHTVVESLESLDGVYPEGALCHVLKREVDGALSFALHSFEEYEEHGDWDEEETACSLQGRAQPVRPGVWLYHREKEGEVDCVIRWEIGLEIKAIAVHGACERLCQEPSARFPSYLLIRRVGDDRRPMRERCVNPHELPEVDPG